MPIICPEVKRLVYRPGTRRRRCEAQVTESTQRWRTYAGKDARCELGATQKVNSRYYCKRHAGDRLIYLLTIGDEVMTTDPL